MRKTKLFEKALPSLMNVSFVAILSIPLTWIHCDTATKKIIVIGLFFAYNLFFLIFNNNRCLGMIITDTHWKKTYPLKNKFMFIFLYSLSFSTLFFWFFFPFDLFLFNMLILQIPLILIKGTTLHGFLSGDMVTIKK